MPLSVIEHVLSRLKDIGITDIFGVPGDYAFPVNDAISAMPSLRWIGCTNELNAAYAADGYARLKGVGALCTTYGVGELSAINGIAGAYAEHLPIFHLVGAPRLPAQLSRAPLHHTLGNGSYDLFFRMTEPVVSARAVMTPQNAARETERLIHEALYHRRPVYMAFPADLADQPVLDTAEPIPMPTSDPTMLSAATEAIGAALASAQSACVLPGILVRRCGLESKLQGLIESSGLPFATMFMDKSILDEAQPAYVGMYDGRLMSEAVRSFVEACNVVLSIGTLMSDFNTGAFTAQLDPARVVQISHHHVRVGNRIFQNVELVDILESLEERLPARSWPRALRQEVGLDLGNGADGQVIHTLADAPIDAPALYRRWADFLSPGDVVIAETGTASMGLGFAALPERAEFHNQTLWGSIGWATPAALGAAVAAPERRVILVTGEGSHQMTAQEIGQFAVLGLKPVIFVLNNDGYLIERLLCKDPEIAYNDVAPWRYADLPRVLGCEAWQAERVVTCAEFDAALVRAERAEEGVYIEVVSPRYAASELALKLAEGLKAQAGR